MAPTVCRKATQTLSALGGDGPFGFGDRVAEVVQDAFGAADEAAAGLGQADVAADALEEEDPDLLLQAGDLSRYG